MGISGAGLFVVSVRVDETQCYAGCNIMIIKYLFLSSLFPHGGMANDVHVKRYIDSPTKQKGAESLNHDLRGKTS